MESKQIRISEYTLTKLREIGESVGNPTDDGAIRHIISTFEINRLRDIVDGYSNSKKAVNRSDKTCEESTYKIINIVAEANKNQLLGKPIDIEFAELMKEFTIFNMFYEFNTKEIEPSAEDIELTKMLTEKCPDLAHSHIKRKKPNAEVTEFIGIMNKRPSNISQDDKLRAFELATDFIHEYGEM